MGPHTHEDRIKRDKYHKHLLLDSFIYMFSSGDRLFSFATAAMCCVSIARVSPFLSSDRLFVHDSIFEEMEYFAIAFLVSDSLFS